jgi:hypothetical protein
VLFRSGEFVKADWTPFVAEFMERIFEVEYALGIRNTANAARFNQRALAEAKHATQK